MLTSLEVPTFWRIWAKERRKLIGTAYFFLIQYNERQALKAFASKPVCLEQRFLLLLLSPRPPSSWSLPRFLLQYLLLSHDTATRAYLFIYLHPRVPQSKACGLCILYTPVDPSRKFAHSKIRLCTAQLSKLQCITFEHFTEKHMGESFSQFSLSSDICFYFKFMCRVNSGFMDIVFY